MTELSEFLHHIVGLNYTDRPDYQLCRGIFTKALKSVGAKPSDKLVLSSVPTAKPASSVCEHSINREVFDTVIFPAPLPPLTCTTLRATVKWKIDVGRTCDVDFMTTQTKQ